MVVYVEDVFGLCVGIVGGVSDVGLVEWFFCCSGGWCGVGS